MSALTPLPNIWAQYGLTEPIPLRNGSEDWIGGGYQEQCMECGILFWGQRDAPFCKSCAAQAKEAAK